MGVQEQITRLSDAKDDIAAAITAKGVTVPDGTKLDGMSALINDISQAAIPETTNLLKGDGSGGAAAAIPGTDYVIPSALEAQKSTCVSVSVPTSGWDGSEAPYTKTVTVEGILESDVPVTDLVASEAVETAEAELEAFALIYLIKTVNGSITVYAKGIPQTAITLQMLCVR